MILFHNLIKNSSLVLLPTWSVCILFCCNSFFFSFWHIAVMLILISAPETWMNSFFMLWLLFYFVVYVLSRKLMNPNTHYHTIYTPNKFHSELNISHVFELYKNIIKRFTKKKSNANLIKTHKAHTMLQKINEQKRSKSTSNRQTQTWDRFLYIFGV